MSKFKNQRHVWAMLLLVGGSSLGLARCGDDGAKNKPKPRPEPEAGAPAPSPPDAPGATPEEAPPDAAQSPAAASGPGESATPPDAAAAPGKKYTEEELMTLVGLSATQSQSAYGHCRDVLAQGIYDRYQEAVSDTVRHALEERFCTMAEDEFAEKVQTYFNEGRSGSHGGSRADSFGFTYMEYIGLEIATSGSSSDSSAQDITRAQATESARKWKTSHCGQSSSAQSSDFEHTVLSEEIDETVVAAWRDCVTKKSNGFFCESSETDDTVSIHLRWDPNAVQSRLLPKLNLRQQTVHNLELSSLSVPDSLGTGSGVAVTYRRVDPKKPSVFEAQGSDPFHQVDFHCSIQVSKVVKGLLKEAEVCGLKEVKLGNGAVCGVQDYFAQRGPACGVESYQARASAACGILAYNSGPDPACAGYVAADTQTRSETAASCVGDARDPDACPEGYMDTGVSQRTKECRGRMDADWTQVISKTRTCQRTEFLATCELPRFGVRAYKTCAHPSHGVYRYNGCRHESFGVESYKTCRHESFGKTFHTCFVPD